MLSYIIGSSLLFPCIYILIINEHQYKRHHLAHSIFHTQQKRPITYNSIVGMYTGSYKSPACRQSGMLHHNSSTLRNKYTWRLWFVSSRFFFGHAHARRLFAQAAVQIGAQPRQVLGDACVHARITGSAAADAP